jgi:hypothetical protein
MLEPHRSVRQTLYMSRYKVAIASQQYVSDKTSDTVVLWHLGQRTRPWPVKQEREDGT